MTFVRRGIPDTHDMLSQAELILALQAYYEATNNADWAVNGPIKVVPLAQYVSDVQCPYPKPPGGNMSLPSWIYSPQTGKCYYKSSFAKGISGNIGDATRRCTVRLVHMRILRMPSNWQPSPWSKFPKSLFHSVYGCRHHCPPESGMVVPILEQSC